MTLWQRPDETRTVFPARWQTAQDATGVLMKQMLLLGGKLITPFAAMLEKPTQSTKIILSHGI